MVTSFPFTTSPFSLVFSSQPTPSPWSALQIHVWSTSVSLLLILKFTLARPTPAPPTRKKHRAARLGPSHGPPGFPLAPLPAAPETHSGPHRRVAQQSRFRPHRRS